MRHLQSAIHLKRSFIAVVLIFLMALVGACGGGDSGTGNPVFGGSSIYEEERNGQTVMVFAISITDSDGNLYTDSVLVQGAAFTPIGSLPIAVPAVGGRAEIIVEIVSNGKYRVGIDGLTDRQGVTHLPQPDDYNANGKVLLSKVYEH